MILHNLLASSFLAVSTKNLTIILITVATIFVVFILIAIIKMYKLKAENKKLMETNVFDEVDDAYEDFTGGHLYGDN